MQTTLLYLEQMDRYTCEARVIAVANENNQSVVILDQTVFYPQGGGQPYDTGTLLADGKKFLVEEVRCGDGIVKHIGTFEGEAFQVGATVICSIDVARRQLHTRLHSAGHLLDMSLKQLGIPWRPEKGYHFPDGPYVEYEGSLEGVDTEKLKADIGASCYELISSGIETRILFLPKEELGSVCAFVPDYLPTDTSARVVLYGNFGIPCGGTHVGSLKEIGRLIIRKIKQSGERVKISYTL